MPIQTIQYLRKTEPVFVGPEAVHLDAIFRVPSQPTYKVPAQQTHFFVGPLEPSLWTFPPPLLFPFPSQPTYKLPPRQTHFFVGPLEPSLWTLPPALSWTPQFEIPPRTFKPVPQSPSFTVAVEPSLWTLPPALSWLARFEIPPRGPKWAQQYAPFNRVFGNDPPNPVLPPLTWLPHFELPPRGRTPNQSAYFATGFLSPVRARRPSHSNTLLHRVDTTDQRLRRFSEILSQLVNSLVGQGYLVQTGVDEWRLRGGGFTETRAPTVLDDASVGVVVGTSWVDQTAGKVWFCVDSTIGAAIWNGPF